VIFFGSYAPEGMSPVLYSFAYNIFYIGGEAVLTLAVLAVPSVRRAVESLKGGYH
jgi:thiamine transporter